MRLVFTRGPKDGISIREIRELQPDLRGKVFVSNYEAGHPPGYAFDGDDSTSWRACEQLFPFYLNLDLGKVEELRGGKHYMDTPEGYCRHTLEFSSDEKGWTPHQEYDHRGDQSKHPLKIEARYIKLGFKKVSKGASLGIREIFVSKK